MLSKSERRKRVRVARQKVLNFLKGEQKKVILSIEGLSHNDVNRIMNGGICGQFRVLLRYLITLPLILSPFMGIKIWCYRRMGMKIGSNVYIAPISYLDITHPQLIHIEDDVMIGMGAAVAVHERNMEFLTLAPVHIGKGCCLGGKALVRCGTRIQPGIQIDAQTAVRGVISKEREF
jgi:acetyltransferase-like isoleucine patch superfamily enzyme